MEETTQSSETRTPEEQKIQRERTLKLITILFMAAILMLFAGLISAVVVTKMDGFWVNLKLPSAFYWSTLTILISSLTYILAKRSAKSNNQGGLKLFLSLTLLLGLGFMYLQFVGWKQLVDSGNMVTGGIYFDKGAYGDRFVILEGDKEIHFDGNVYTIEGDTLSAEQENDLIKFVYPICREDRKFIDHAYDFNNYGAPYSIGIKSKTDLKSTPLTLADGKLFQNGVELAMTEKSTLFAFAFGVKNETAFFGMKGEYGKDFSVSLNGQVLTFIDRKLYFPSPELGDDEKTAIETKHYEGGKEYVIKEGKVYSEGKEVSVNDFHFVDSHSGADYYIMNGAWFLVGEEINAGQYNKFFDASNTASSFVYVLSALHGMHILFGYGLLVVLLFRSTRGYYNSESYTGMTVGGYFWHFLGVLWIGLFLFWMSITI